MKRLGLDDAAIVELMAVVDFFNGTNALADGLGLEPDVLPPDDSSAPRQKSAGKGRGRTRAKGRRSRR